MATASSMARFTVPRIPQLVHRQQPIRQHLVRPFSSTSASLAAVGQRRMVSPQQSAQPSLKMQMKRAAGRGDQKPPTDVGLLPSTFVRPTGSNLPSMFSSPRERFALEKVWLTTRVMDIVGRVTYKFFIRKEKPRPKLQSRKELAEIGRELYHKMYSAFAAGDLATLEKSCATGLLSTFGQRLARRPATEKLTWILHNYKGRAKVVSNRCARLPIPGIEETAIRQVVVRIRSSQSLRRKTILPRNRITTKAAAGESTSRASVPNSDARDVTEHIVIQKMMLRGKEDTDWIIWGTMEETTLEAWKESEKQHMEAVAAAEQAGL